ncbi:hypothetical protein AB0P32_31865 [Streptomyces sp. NPDC085995]|uniref:hypothetical protein n=1 Tax=Streptomyces sp. NPDC085995 TaxID=3154861 RepID=UPI00343F1703
MPTKSATATVRSRYAEQAASDLAENRRQQQELTRQLETLQQEETLLLDILSLAGHPAADAAHVPQQARNEPEPAARQAPSVPEPAAAAPDTSAEDAPAGRPAPAESEDAAAEAKAPKAAAKAAPKSPAKKRAAKNTAKPAAKSTTKSAPKSTAKSAPKGAAKTAAKSTGKAAAKKDESQVLLRDLLLDLLGGHSEPRLAAELREELLAKHPDREPTPQVVRNTLEALVAKGRIQRHKQGRSVMYTVVGQEKDGAQAGAA